MSLGRLVRNALSSAVQVVVSAGLLFELYRFANHYVSIEQIGIWSIVMASASLGRLADLGMGGGIVRFVAVDMGSGERGSAACTIGMAVTAVAVVMAGLCVLLFPVLWIVLANVIRDPGELSAARELLPLGLVCLWVSMLGTLLLSSLDGAQRTDIRAGITVAGGVVQLAAAYLLVPSVGLTGLAVAQVVQAVCVALASFTGIAVLLRQPFGAWLRWDWPRAKEMLRYGGALQFATVGQMLFDPTVKMLLSLYGGLAMTGYYEMANRMMTQFRAVIVSAYQMLVPYVAAEGPDRTRAGQTYLAAYRLLVFLAFPYYAAIAIVLPFFLYFWLGRWDSSFLVTALYSLLGWTLNTMVAPAYFLYLAQGRAKWPVVAQVSIGVLNLVLGLVLGAMLGATGVLAAAALALGAGSAVVVVAFQMEFDIPLANILPRESRWLMAIVLVGTLVAVWVGYGLSLGWVEVSTYLAVASLASLAIVIAAWRSEHRKSILSLLGRAVSP